MNKVTNSTEFPRQIPNVKHSVGRLIAVGPRPHGRSWLQVSPRFLFPPIHVPMCGANSLTRGKADLAV